MNINDHLPDPIIDTLRMKDWLGNVSDKRGKIARMIHAGEIFQLRRGLYATRRDIHPYCLAASVYGPSYISFETVDLTAAADEVRPFLRDARELSLWSKAFFKDLTCRLVSQ